MRLAMSDRKAVIKAWSSQYRKTRKKEKGRILDELVALTGYNRWYVVGLLRWDGKVIRAGRRVRLVGDLQEGQTHKTSPERRGGAGWSESDLGDHGLHLRETAGGDPAGGYSGAGETPGDCAGCYHAGETAFDQRLVN